VVLSAAADPLGQRVTAALGREATVDRIVVVGDDELHSSDLKARIEGATAVVHLHGGVDETRKLLAAAGSVGVQHLVLLSSATAYGAWPNNPVPLTEDAPLRPNPDLEFAVRAAERERLAAEWKHDHPGTTVTVLRPAVPVAEEMSGWLARGLREASAIRPAGPDDPPCQYVHLDDLASAIVLALGQRLDGPFNVAPDGWIPGDRLRALEGGPRVRVPEPVARRFAWLRWRLNPSSAPPGLLPFTLHSWVVANDRIKAAGWAPAFSNEESYVAGHKAAPWATVSPQRRQEIALAGAGAGVIAVVLAIVLLIRRRSGRRASRTE
jgi:nucleoside-diphosphate-sugar epimerase